MTDLELIDIVLSQPPLVTHRVFLHITQELKSAAFLGQLYYWSKKMNHGWFYKTAESWEEELFLSWEEQKRIRKHLIKLGLLEEKRKGSPAKIYFKINLNVFITIAKQYYSQIQGKPETSIRESLNPDSGKPGNLNQGKPESLYTENTTENTQREKDISNDISKVQIPYSEIIGYLNQKAGTSYRADSKENRALVKARWNGGFGVEDFKRVVDNMADKWLTDEKMCQYLRPATLFGSKFESYLQIVSAKRKNVWGEIENE